jgi:tRNA U38,U39,U40 pseudouridine synthase TruA
MATPNSLLAASPGVKEGDREPEEGDREMRLMGAAGDTKIIWNPDNSDEVDAAKKTFDDLVGNKRFCAFKVSADGKKGEQIREFDKDAEKLIIAPPMAGG